MNDSRAAPIIELRGVDKTYPGAGGGFTALRHIDLGIMAGERVAIVGKSGSGKSTLLNMLTGIDHPSSGTVRVNGVDLHALDESRLASWRGRHIGIVFQFFQLIPTLSIVDNLLLAMEFVKSIPASERRPRAERLLAQVGLVRHAAKPPAALSGGEQQRAAVARALANDPPIVVADEPTGNLDTASAELVHTLFEQLARAGKTVIVVTHDRTLSERYERIVTLADGAVQS